MNRLFVINKPIFISSNHYANRVKRRYKFKKIGYSGTLDPFATGTLIVATGQYTKLFSYLKKSPKLYRATIWLGAESDTLDIEGVREINSVERFDIKRVEDTLASMLGEIEYYPPKYSAKKIDGKRAYELARAKKEVNLKKIKSTIYQIRLLNYSHPFLHFETLVSEGSYIRSFGEIISSRLGVVGALSSLERVREGEFYFQGERELNPLEFLDIPQNIFLGEPKKLELGVKLRVDDFESREDGVYWVDSRDFFSIIEISSGEVKYRLNLIQKGKSDL